MGGQVMGRKGVSILGELVTARIGRVGAPLAPYKGKRPVPGFSARLSLRGVPDVYPQLFP
jgi:hypothetical protein